MKKYDDLVSKCGECKECTVYLNRIAGWCKELRKVISEVDKLDPDCRLPDAEPKVCRWTWSDKEKCFDTCFEPTRKDISVKFCPYCGGKIQEVKNGND